MFQNDELKNHIETSSTVDTQSAIIAEWNMNIPTNILKIGNYRYRPTSNKESDAKYRVIPNTFDPNDSGNYYTDATDADVVIDGGFDDSGLPTTLIAPKDKIKMLYSLEDCIKPFRPRSGINKARFFRGRHIHNPNMQMARRPRYYMSDKNDIFKYWSSYRTENGIEYGISSNSPVSGRYIIEDTAPFIVYKDSIPTNRIILKMQTNVGDINLGTSDPFYGDSNRTVPLKWKIQYLKNNSWIDAISFNEGSTRSDGSAIIKSDGYVEIAYGLIIPAKYKDIFVYAETLASETLRPEQSVNGYAYLIQPNENEIGTYHIWYNGIWETFIPRYGWQLQEETVDRLTNFVTDLTSPVLYTNPIDGTTKYREFEYINGIRIVVENMVKNDSPLDLIEISPRLSVNLTEKTLEYGINKSASDLGISGLPVGQLLASTGSLTVFDYDDAFNINNPNSIVSKYITKNLQIKFYEIISNVNGYDYYIPLKTMYSEGFPKIDNANKKATLTLRDLYFYFESMTAPQVLFTNVSVSSAVSMLLDYVGFSNYVFKRVSGESETIIPYFYVAPDKSVAEVLQDIAISTQTSMFFDEYNNFVMMSKNYLLPSNNERNIDITLYGTKESADTGVTKNSKIRTQLENIIEITSQDNRVYNDGKVSYNTKHIERSVGSIRQASLVDSEKTWIYKPVPLWEVSGTENTKSVNGQVSNQSTYVLAAMPLNSDLSAIIPTVANNKVINNTMDFGESVYWITRYNGYFYANGEVIKYDAVEYNVAGVGNVWITSAHDYDNYFSNLPFNGKIYPTGLVRIYSEPNYEENNGILKLKNGAVAKHGRGQFGTDIVYHSAGLNNYWSDNSNVRGCTMESAYLFKTGQQSPNTVVGAAGVSNTLAQKTTRNSIIKNFLSSKNIEDKTTNLMTTTQTGTVQSSALVMNGPNFTTTEKPLDFISYVYKPLTDKFKHFGTRMRIIGKIETNTTRGQTPIGSTTYYTIPGTTPDQSISIAGGSGGLAVMVNPETNNGYYFEIIALGANNLTSDQQANVNNVIFYKVKKSEFNSNAIPEKLYEGLANIIVDDGKFTGQYRLAAEENPTVYDLAVEYQDIGTTRRFYLYINNNLIAIVNDTNPLPAYNNMGLFTRGSSRIMFENIYAVTNNYSQNMSFGLDAPVKSVFSDATSELSEPFRKYALSGIVQSTYISGISPNQPPQFKIYYDEFGTIMREASSFNIRYDKAYPALYAKISPTFNSIRGYTVSGFRAGSYGAEFLIFNATDTALSLDETTGNYLRIQGVTFTQDVTNELTVDSFFSKNSDFSNPQISQSVVVSSPFKYSKDYEDIKLSRITYGKKDFSVTAPYIQSHDDANKLMEWLIYKVMKPRKSVGVKIFSNPMIQLGDIVNIDYIDNGLNRVATTDQKFVVYNIEYQKSKSGPEMTIFLSEVK